MIHEAHLVVFAAWLVGWILLFRVPRVPRAPRRRNEPVSGDIGIVIPARNEAEALPKLLGDLARHRPPQARVFVVNDHSTDGTDRVAARFGFVEVVDVPDQPTGWIGKARACDIGAGRAPEGALVFLDADVRVPGDAIDRLVEVRRERGGLVSVWPYHDVRRVYEHASALFNLIALMAVGCGSLLPTRRVRGAFGPVLVTQREEYRRVGGHDAVRGEIVEDFALAHLYRDASLPVNTFGGHRDVTFRMYPDGPRALFQGWTKNYGTAALSVSWFRLLAIGFWLVCGVGLFTWAGGVPAWPAWVLYGLYVFQMWFQLRQVGAFGLLDALLYPVHVLVFGLLFLVSLFRTFVLRRVSWRGRTIPLGSAPAQAVAHEDEEWKEGTGS